MTDVRKLPLYKDGPDIPGPYELRKGLDGKGNEIIALWHPEWKINCSVYAKDFVFSDIYSMLYAIEHLHERKITQHA